MNKKLIKSIAEKEKKKIGVEAMIKINNLLEIYIKKIIQKASRNADFAGRKIIKQGDIE